MRSNGSGQMELFRMKFPMISTVRNLFYLFNYVMDLDAFLAVD